MFPPQFIFYSVTFSIAFVLFLRNVYYRNWEYVLTTVILVAFLFIGLSNQLHTSNLTEWMVGLPLEFIK